MEQAHYNVAEVLFLLSIPTYEEAVRFDASPQSALGHLRDRDKGAGGSSGEVPPPVVVRWREVRDTKRAIVGERDAAILDFRLQQHMSAAEAGDLVGLTEGQVRRRYTASAEAIIERLGGLSDADEVERQTARVEDLLHRYRLA